MWGLLRLAPINKLKLGTKAKVLLTEAIWFLFEVDKCFHSKVIIAEKFHYYL